MKLTRGLLSFSLIFSLGFISFLSLSVHKVIAQDGKIAIQRGYRTGYSDGYMAGYRDTLDGAAKSYTKHEEYSDATRAYSKDYGTVEDYRDGYQQGFESGYNTGFEKKSFDSNVPAELNRRGAAASTNAAADTSVAATPAETGTSQTTELPGATTQAISYKPQSDAMVIILKDTELILELQDDLNTSKNKAGDKFTAKVVSPSELAGAVIEGRVDKIQKPGRLKKRSEMSLSFDRIILTEERWGNFNGILTEVLPIKGDNVRRIDDEGTAIGKSSIKPDVVKVGAATGGGAVIGAVAGGPVGAAVGAGVGAAFGVGAVVIERGKHIRLNKNQQLRIKTAYETRIR